MKNENTRREMQLLRPPCAIRTESGDAKRRQNDRSSCSIIHALAHTESGGANEATTRAECAKRANERIEHKYKLQTQVLAHKT